MEQTILRNLLWIAGLPPCWMVFLWLHLHRPPPPDHLIITVRNYNDRIHFQARKKNWKEFYVTTCLITRRPFIFEDTKFWWAHCTNKWKQKKSAMLPFKSLLFKFYFSWFDMGLFLSLLPPEYSELYILTSSQCITQIRDRSNLRIELNESNRFILDHR